MTFLYLKYDKIFKTGKLVLLLITTTVMILSLVRGTQILVKTTNDEKPSAIEEIYIDTKQKLIKIRCSFPKKLTEKDTITVNIKKKGMYYTDVYIKNTDTLPGNTLILGIQPPLKDPLYGIEKCDVTVQSKTENGIIKASKATILGTTTQRFDLRAYTTLKPSTYIVNGIVLLLGVSLILMLAVPVIRKYRFKKHTIKKYRQITAEDKAKLDPFTFEEIEEKDDVVVINNNTMLLRSWKRLNTLKTEDRPEEFNMFFEEGGKSNFFKPLTGIGKRINRMWFGMMGTYTGWLLYILLMQFDFEPYLVILSEVFNNAAVQFSGVIYMDSILAISLGVTTGVAFLIREQIYSKHASVFNIIFRLILGLLLPLFFFYLQFIVNVYLINNSFFGTLITWLCIGLGLSSIAGIQTGIRKTIIAGSMSGFIGFTVWQLCKLGIFSDVLSTEITLLISLLFAGITLGGLTYIPALVSRELHHTKNSATASHNEISEIQDNESPLKKAV